jgi:hypothetical protein
VHSRQENRTDENESGLQRTTGNELLRESVNAMDSGRTAPELTREEKALLIQLEPYLREVWCANLKTSELGETGLWGTRKLVLPKKMDNVGKPSHLNLTLSTPNEDFFESCCVTHGQHFHTVTAVYQILRTLKKRGMLNVPGFECTDARPPSKIRD